MMRTICRIPKTMTPTRKTMPERFPVTGTTSKLTAAQFFVT
jgi:hypothetical protein